MQIHYQWNNILCIRFQNVMIKVVAKYQVSENMALAKNYLVKYDDAICSFYITFFQTMSYLRKHSCCIWVSSNRCIVISHFEYYSVYIKRYVFSILKTKYTRLKANLKYQEYNGYNIYCRTPVYSSYSNYCVIKSSRKNIIYMSTVIKRYLQIFSDLLECSCVLKLCKLHINEDINHKF